MTESVFPPNDLTGFLQLCAGEWLALRSLMALEMPQGDAEEDRWHQSERGELRVLFLEPLGDGDAGGLEIQPQQHCGRRLRFQAGGTYSSEEAGGAAGPAGDWQLWPDGSLELSQGDGERMIRERLWFTQPNLRLRSIVESRSDGSPGRASFSSEIRRVSRPPAA